MADLKQQYFWIELDSDGYIEGFSKYNHEYSYDESVWNNCTDKIYVEGGKKVYFRNKYIEKKLLTNVQFTTYGIVGGDLCSFINMQDQAFLGFFKNNIYLYDASELILSETVNFGCYESMFEGCTSLVNAPALPATTLAVYCYQSMFEGCTSLVNAPALPATTLAEYCYSYMFYGCTSLVNAPALPATTLAVGCYQSMFGGCASLVNAPILPATTLVGHCYAFMFLNCTSLNYIKMLATTDIEAGSCLNSWVGNVAPSGTFVKVASADILVDSVYGIPVGWTVYNEGDPNIPDPDNPGGGGGEDPDNPTDPDNPNPPVDPDTPYVTGTTIELFFNYDGTPKTTNEFDVYWYGDYYDRNLVNDSSHFGVSGKKIETTDDYVKFHYTVNCPQNTTSEVITGSCYFNIKLDASTYGESFVVEFIQDAKVVEPDPDEPDTPVEPDEPDTPVEPDEPYIEPVIGLYKTRLDYSEDGGEQRVQVDYYGATTILTPSCPQSWVTIKKTQSGYYDENGVRVDQHQYKITMEPSTFSRSTYVTFSCTDVNGKVFSDNNLRLYQSGPSNGKPSVTVSKTQVNLNNVGETSDIQVTYINVDEIIPPTAPEGYEIEEVSRTDGEQGIQIVYRVKRVSTKGSNGSIDFSGSGSDGSTATSSKVNVSGSDVPAEFMVGFGPKDGDTFIVGEEGNDSYITLYVYGYTGEYNFSYSINGDSSAIYVINEKVWDSEDEDAHLNFDIYFDAIPNNTNNPYTGTIDLFYKDEVNNYNTSVPFKVRYANEGQVRVNVDSYNFDKDGNRIDTQNDMFIDAHYIKIASINDPVVDVDWFHLEDGVRSDYKGLVDGEYVVVGDSYRHNFTIDANSGPARKGTITFSGKGIDGKDHSFVLDINQEGSDTQKPIDEGFIELQQLSVELMADGGAQRFQVKYYDAREIFEPELEYDWATITEVSRTEPVPDVAWNGEECDSLIITYEVTATPTTSGRQMKVKFKSDINYYDGSVVHMEKDKFIVYQLAEGQTEVNGSLVLLRGSNEFTYYGTPVNWDIEVGYIGVTAETPTFNVDWCRVGETIQNTRSTEYDYINKYILDMDENPYEVSRQCVITIRALCEDGSYIENKVVLTQQGREDIINEGEYDNYKGYFRDLNETLYSVSFITNPRIGTYGDIRLAGDSPVVVSYSDSETLYEPLRTSTCTVKVVSSVYLMNLYTGKAQGTQVIIRNEETGIIQWCGYLQPNMYNQGYSSPVEVIEFEASDCLSVLEYMEYEYYYNGNGQPMIVSFKDIISSTMDTCGLISSYAFTEKLYSNSDETKILDFKDFYISENNFYSEEGEPWTYKEVLEETCKYFGFVCFQWGDRVYFMDYDKFTANKTMQGFVYDKSTRWDIRTSETLSTPTNITVDSYMGSDGDMSLDDVFNKVSVNCNYYNIESVIPDLFDDDSLVERNGITITTLANRGQEIGSQTSYMVYDHKNIKSHFYKPIVGEDIHEIEVTPTEEEFNSRTFFETFVGGNIVDMYHMNYSDVSGRSYESKEWERMLMISQLNRPWCRGPRVGDYDVNNYWEKYNFPIMEFTQLPQIFIDNNEEVYTSNSSTGSTGGRVPSTGSGGSVAPRSTTSNRGFGSSSTTSRNDRDTTINVNKSKHYFVIKAEAAFTPDFGESYVPEGVDQTGFGKWSNSQYGSHTFPLIKGTTSKNYSFTPSLTFYLEIPQVGWWDGSKWVDYETWFEVPLEDLHYTNEVWYTWKKTKNKVETNLFLGEAGYKIQLPAKMESTAFMQFKIGMPKRFAVVSPYEGGDDTGDGGNAYCFIKNLEMKIVSKNTSLIKDEDIVYENVIDGNNVVDGPEIDLKITSDNNITYSYSTVRTKFGSEDKPTTNFRFYDLAGELILPEEAIIEKYVNQYSTPTIKETVTLDLSFKPTQLINDTYWDKDFVIIGQELDFQKCSQTITLLEKK